MTSIYAIGHVPYIARIANEQALHFFASGGALASSIPTDALKHPGKRKKLFKVIGHGFLPTYNFITFTAEVNTWEYIAPNQRYPGFSTKDWRIQYLSYREKPNDDGYQYYGVNMVFRNRNEYQRWKHTYRGVEFPGEHPNHFAVFYYREQECLLSFDDWTSLNLPLDTRRCNGIIHVKVAYDDVNHMITTYRFTNGGYLDEKQFSPFARAKGAMLILPASEPNGRFDHRL